ncbi:kinetochore protein mis13 [Blumeria hordei DH14]|uniref:Kinetochore protein mis13 n=1 Tax=Blumeria graminis f. sp. hordei (strain DH14) TaxID=546991 RepID=N1J9U0_BLUG1|nr:kinetochore protein mis13 [Blumeria hordei DH14]
MTTILQTANSLEPGRMSQPTAARRSKRLAGEISLSWRRSSVNPASAYDEEDGDFVFTRASKRTKSRPSEHAAASVSTPAPVVRRTKASKQTHDREHEPTLSNTQSKGSKRSNSTPQYDNDPLTIPRSRKTPLKSGGRGQKSKTPATTIASATANDQVQPQSILKSVESQQLPVEHNKSSTVVQLPWSDTPVIDRNKEFRKKAGGSARRSSLGMRGRRASSLINNGHSAIPHREVETKDFYKYIEAEGLSEPRRMKQLLVWSSERCMGPKPLHGDPDSAAELAARHIKEALLKEFSSRSEYSDWFSRDETTPTKIVKLPNPRNVELENSLAIVESRLKLLQEERDQWKAQLKRPAPLAPIHQDGKGTLNPSDINSSLLDPEQAAILAEVSSCSSQALRKQASDRLRTLQSGLEFHVDQLADGVHKLEKYQETVGKIADKFLNLGQLRLEERDKRVKEQIGTRDLPMQEVLRSLSRILP